MQFRYVFKRMESSDTLRDYTESKLRDRIEKYVTNPIEVQVTYSVDKHNQQVRCSLTGGDGFNIDVEHTCNDIYASVDNMLDKLTVQLQKQKDKIKDYKRHNKEGSIKNLDLDQDYIDAEDIVKYEKLKKSNG